MACPLYGTHDSVFAPFASALAAMAVLGPALALEPVPALGPESARAPDGAAVLVVLDGAAVPDAAAALEPEPAVPGVQSCGTAG
ncbi:MAG TPA: hypothetical protein VFT22_11770 [Kofleriaceae bacterium]|nr:hypothetical protein [Kofleriaceae bacterium]